MKKVSHIIIGVLFLMALSFVIIVNIDGNRNAMPMCEENTSYHFEQTVDSTNVEKHILIDTLITNNK